MKIKYLTLSLFCICLISCRSISPQCRDAISECAILPTPPSAPTTAQCQDYLKDLKQRLVCMTQHCPIECQHNPEMCAIASAGGDLLEYGDLGNMSQADADVVTNKMIDAALSRVLLSADVLASGDDPRVPPEMKQDCKNICQMRRACKSRGISIPYPKLCQDIGIDCPDLAIKLQNIEVPAQ